MSKRKRKEQLRLNEQTQFTLKWPTFEDTGVAIKALAAFGKLHPASSKPTGLMFGTNAVVRSLIRMNNKHNTQDNHGTTTKKIKIANAEAKESTRSTTRLQSLVFVAKHTHQLLIRHVPFLAAQHPGVVKCYGLPLSSQRLGMLFGLRSAAVVSVSVPMNSQGDKELSDSISALMEVMHVKPFVKSHHFVNFLVGADGNDKNNR